MHVLPRVAELHRRFERELVVVGVHAGKYPAERLTPEIRAACRRLGVTHPVVNDRQFRVWREYAVQAWPTVVLVSPDGRIIARHAGEFAVEEMAGVIARAVAAFDAEDLIDRTPLDFGTDPEAVTEPSGPLRFPGRLALSGEMLYVSDSGHDRILELRLSADGGSATIERAFGGGASGFADADLECAQFNEPQGLALHGDTLLVADRRNHAIRAIDLTAGEVTTLAGTGDLGYAALRTGPARDASLRSPFDIVVDGSTAFVAMAGSHQIARIEMETGVLSVHAGAGAESIADGPALDALLAQPMGLAVAHGSLAFADAESSSVRLTGTAAEASVRTLVGTGLFDFGDRDGTGDDVLLQHPESLAWHGGALVVADTYNDRLKRVDPASRSCAALPGDAGGGSALAHPTGVASDGVRLYVADTGNHRIVLVDAESGALRELQLTEGGSGSGEAS